ncbi:hypothetical protein [Sphingomonas sp. TREG-RG-20F-R18-01]|uniref:hypothetical protein n=1 Tax=Sphingomonas sp. TREG-RG-20F-R18-01 TaxID=2914982 RepID=UPI001F56BAF4|nr:hypothetical protein [Sphingomonas sp. TREG-RG-20F-R18-01]
MIAASAKGAATKLTSPDPKLATEVAMALSTYVYIVVKSVMMLGAAAGITAFPIFSDQGVKRVATSGSCSP